MDDLVVEQRAAEHLALAGILGGLGDQPLHANHRRDRAPERLDLLFGVGKARVDLLHDGAEVSENLRGRRGRLLHLRIERGDMAESRAPRDAQPGDPVLEADAKIGGRRVPRRHVARIGLRDDREHQRRVMNGAGQIIGPLPLVCTAILRGPIRLAPGESIAWTAPWPGPYASPLSSQGAALLPAGQYRLRGLVQVIGVGAVRSAPVMTRLDR